MLKINKNCSANEKSIQQNTQINPSYQHIPKKFRKMEKEQNSPHMRKGFSSPTTFHLLSDAALVQPQVSSSSQSQQEKLIQSILLRLNKLQHNSYSMQSLQVKLKHIETQITNVQQQLKTVSDRRSKTSEQNKFQKQVEIGHHQQGQFQLEKASETTKIIQIEFKTIQQKLKTLLVQARADIITEVSQSHKMLMEAMTGKMSDKMENFKKNWNKDWLQNFNFKAYPAEKQRIEPEGKQKTIPQTNYLVDNTGHLLDSNQQYLVNGRGNRIQLKQAHLEKLRSQGLMNYNFKINRKASKERDSRVSYKITTG